MGGEREDGFEDWYRREHPRVLGVLCAVSGDPILARDATDEAFVRALDRWTRVRDMDSPAGWTYRVALNQLRKERGRRRPDEVDEAVAPEPTTYADLWDAVRRLPPRQQTALVLRYIADLPEADIAAVMQVARGTVASTLYDARTRLAGMLAEAAVEEDVTK
ncbi:MAG: sigma-70 family RNA polymerase sigma factor [Acidimicrobiales bacterium]